MYRELSDQHKNSMPDRRTDRELNPRSWENNLK